MTPDSARTRGTVLIIEDEVDLADLYAEYLEDEYDVVVAYGGEEGLELADKHDPDVLLLDRRMPVISGNEVLAQLENYDSECRVAMVTAVNPDFDIIDLRIDDYLVKPVTRDEVRETVDRLITLDEYNERMQHLTAKKLKRNVLELEKTGMELTESEEFERLSEEIEGLKREIADIADELDVEGIEKQF